jgi:hypothetical protein
VAFSIRPGGNEPVDTLHITASPEETKVVLKATPNDAEVSVEAGAVMVGRRRSSLPLSLQPVNKEAQISTATEPNFITLMGESLLVCIARATRGAHDRSVTVELTVESAALFGMGRRADAELSRITVSGVGDICLDAGSLHILF